MSPLTALLFALLFAIAGCRLSCLAASRGHSVEAYAAAGLSALISAGLVGQIVV